MTEADQSDHISGQMYAIDFSPAALADVVALRAFDRARIVAEIRSDLIKTPTMSARHRKLLRDLRPQWEHVPPLWQLRVGEFRVFYDVDEVEHVVYIRRVIWKGWRTTGEIV